MDHKDFLKNLLYICEFNCMNKPVLLREYATTVPISKTYIYKSDSECQSQCKKLFNQHMEELNEK